MIFDVSPSFLTAMIGYVSGLFSDLLPLVLLFTGLTIGFYLIETMIKIARLKKEVREREYQEFVKELERPRDIFEPVWEIDYTKEYEDFFVE